ncbi:MAG: YdcF family protein [Acetobacteraceae bacterium]
MTRVRRARWWTIPLMVVGGLFIAWACGLWWFIGVAGRPGVLPPIADGIVALTGGAGRIETAFALLADRRAERLLISGIGGNTDLASLAHRGGVDPARFADRVTLGRNAASTHGNAVETAAWARQHSIRSLIVVTAYYHMPRTMTEFAQAMPEIRLYPYPVLMGDRRIANGHVPFRLLIEEYSKYLVTASGLAGWFPSREAGRGGRT